MISAVPAAKYLLHRDAGKVVFTDTYTKRNGKTICEGSVRLNCYLHLAQNLHIAKTGERLFSEDLYADDNGAVILSVKDSYPVLSARRDYPATVEKEAASFLDSVYELLKNASLDELITLSQEDNAWIEKHRFPTKPERRMNSLFYAAEYAEQYKDALQATENSYCNSK